VGEFRRTNPDDRSPILPEKVENFYVFQRVPGAAYRIRTCDPRITNAMLYQLS
jgi:hypothetical protein